MSVSDVFGPNGYLRQSFPGYTPRVGQIEMALTVDAVAEAGSRAAVEAPTGTGKSVAYLAPLIPRAARGERVMVVTAGIALSEQLVGKDLPMLQSVLPERFTFALAKGLNNYLCLVNFGDASADFKMMGIREQHEREQWPEIERWAGRTETGDVSELPFELDGRVRLKVTTTSDECLGKSCPKHSQCFAVEARKRTKAAQIVVTNYHLFFADLALKAGDPEAGPLPPYRHVVLDEAHDAAEIARDFFGFRVSPHAVRRATRFLSGNAGLGIPEMPKGDQIKKLLRSASDDFFASVEAASKRRDYKGRVEGPGLFDPTQLITALRPVAQAYGDAAVHCDQAGVEALAKGIERISAIGAQLSLAAANEEPTKRVYFIEAEPIAVAMKPIDVAPMLRKHLFERVDVKSVTACSATLATGPSDFDYFREEVGMPEDAEQLQVDSPFDYDTNALLYLPRIRVEPNDPRFPEEVAATVLQVALAAGGRTLALFTSYRILRATREYLSKARPPWRVLAQGEAPRTELVRQFKADETSVLLGCESFWQGVDVPGPALSAVVIDRVPFAHHDDPVMGAIQQRNKAWFVERAIPEAVTKVKQGFGRLIRTSTDRGVVAICDPRLRSKGYGKKILRALPEGMPHTRDIADVRRFFVG